MVVMLLYTFLPEYLFPMLTSLSLLCWVAPRNAVANFVGAGIGGMGFLNLTMDWTNISSLSLTNPMVVPFWTTVVLTTAFVFNCWVLVPAAKWGGLGTWKPRLMSNKVFLANGTVYPTSELMTHDLRFNETAYHMLGPVHMGTQQLWAMFFDYSTYVSALAWLLFFGWDRIRETTRKLRARAHRAPGQSISSVYSDRLNGASLLYACIIRFLNQPALQSSRESTARRPCGGSSRSSSPPSSRWSASSPPATCSFLFGPCLWPLQRRASC